LLYVVITFDAIYVDFDFVVVVATGRNAACGTSTVHYVGKDVFELDEVLGIACIKDQLGVRFSTVKPCWTREVCKPTGFILRARFKLLFNFNFNFFLVTFIVFCRNRNFYFFFNIIIIGI
jgi:hypothetical protein